MNDYRRGDGWLPIGTESERFKGHFDGNGYVIENLTIDRPAALSVGLFGLQNPPQDFAILPLKMWMYGVVQV